MSHEIALSARRALLEKEKEFTRLADELRRQQRALQWEVVTKEYIFDGPDGKEAFPISLPGVVSSSYIT